MILCLVEAESRDSSREDQMPKKPASATKPAAPSKKPAATKAAPAKAAAKPARTVTAKAAKAEAPATITLKHLAAKLADGHEMTKRQTDAVLSDLVALVTDHLKTGDRIRIAGLGILQVRHRAARMGRNPATGEAIKIKASKKIAFRPAKELKEAV
jgi:DNA-binding protein HU-beta